MFPGYTPAVNPVMFGVTVIETVDAGGMFPGFGEKLNHFGAVEPVPLNVTADEVRFEILRFCGLSVAPGAPRNSNPVGETTGGTAVPAGTIFSTIEIETGGCFPSVGVSVTDP
jgi:hypothetical protein